MRSNFFIKYRSILLYGATLAAALFVMKWLEWRFLILNNAFEIYAGIIAVLFTALGIWLALKLSTPRVDQVISENPASAEAFVLNEGALIESGATTFSIESGVVSAESGYL